MEGNARQSSDNRKRERYDFEERGHSHRSVQRDYWQTRQNSALDIANQAIYYATVYHPVQAGSIDGTDLEPHDHAVYRALIASEAGLYDAANDSKAEGDPHATLFIGRLSSDTNEDELENMMSKYGEVKGVRLVRDIVTGASRRYAFIEFRRERDMRRAYREAHGTLDPHMSKILVDYNRQGLMPGWIPRRLGGGLGGRKESGQLRFGGRDRPFHAPLKEVPREELMKRNIPLPPESGFFTRAQTPPLPEKKHRHRDREKRRSHRHHRSRDGGKHRESTKR